MGAYEHYLAHHGIKGQKWGVRRFQDENGNLTAEGKAKYGEGNRTYADKGAIRKWTLGSEGGEYAFAKWRSRRHDKNLAKARAKGNEKKIEKYESKKAAQDAANANLDAYRKHHDTASLVIQNHLLTTLGGNAYRHARARGESQLSAMFEVIGPAAPFVTMYRDKKAYGKYIVFSGMEE